MTMVNEQNKAALLSRPDYNGFGNDEPASVYNVIGERYFSATDSEKKAFIEIATKKAMELGSEQRNFAKMFSETHSKLPISNVYTYFLHAAHALWGMSFNLTVKARSAQATTSYIIHDGKELALTVETI